MPSRPNAGSLSLALSLAAVAVSGCGAVTTGTTSGTESTSTLPAALAGESATSTSVTVGVATAGQGVRITQAMPRLAYTATFDGISYSSAPAQGSGFGEAPVNGEYAVADVTVTSLYGPVPVDPLYFRYQTAGGLTYASGNGNASWAGFGPPLDATTLFHGQSASGRVVFDVPPGRGSVLQIVNGTGDIVGQWSLTGAGSPSVPADGTSTRRPSTTTPPASTPPPGFVRCGPYVSVTGASCVFARTVLGAYRQGYHQHGLQPNVTVTATSPVTSRPHTLTCLTHGATVTCSDRAGRGVARFPLGAVTGP